MSTLKQYSEREFLIILRKNGYIYTRSSGSSHMIYKNGKKEISIPKGEPNKMLARRLIKENNLRV